MRISRVLLTLSPVCLFWTGAAQASCDINFVLRNQTAVNVTVNIASAEVRSGVNSVAWGTWRRATRGGWFDSHPGSWMTVQAGSTRGDTYRASLSCSARRQFRITYSCQGGPRNGSTYVAQETFGAQSINNFGVGNISVGTRCD